MARYIDADKLIAHLKDEIKGCEPPFGSRANGKSIAYGTKLGLKSAISFAETLATADVAPKSEVEELKAIIADHKANEECWEELYRNTKIDVAREIFEELEKSLGEFKAGSFNLRYLKDVVAEIKKKYTEVQE